MPMATLSIAAPMATPITVPKAMVLPSFMAALPGLSTAAPLDIRQTRTSVRPVRLINPGFEIGGLLDQARCHIRVRDCPCKFEKRSCLTRQILPAHHCRHLRIVTPADVTFATRCLFRTLCYEVHIYSLFHPFA